MVQVGVGVPVMLAYVYGVVPLSLCRNGSCGVSASSSGVRLDLDGGPEPDGSAKEEKEETLTATIPESKSTPSAVTQVYFQLGGA